jgi:PqqD family protein of HPr-rel-A system
VTVAGPVYAADSPGLSHRVDLEGLTVLYHRPSGMTHVLAPPAPQILDALASGPATPAEVAERMARSFDVESEDPAAAVAARLAELEAAGLVWRP